MAARVVLDCEFTDSPSAWCGCGVSAIGPGAQAAIQAHLRDSPTCRTAMVLVAMKLTKRAPRATSANGTGSTLPRQRAKLVPQA